MKPKVYYDISNLLAYYEWEVRMEEKYPNGHPHTKENARRKRQMEKGMLRYHDHR